jgi:hypothetical protein
MTLDGSEEGSEKVIANLEAMVGLHVEDERNVKQGIAKAKQGVLQSSGGQ